MCESTSCSATLCVQRGVASSYKVPQGTIWVEHLRFPSCDELLKFLRSAALDQPAIVGRTPGGVQIRYEEEHQWRSWTSSKEKIFLGPYLCLATSSWSFKDRTSTERELWWDRRCLLNRCTHEGSPVSNDFNEMSAADSQLVQEFLLQIAETERLPVAEVKRIFSLDKLI